MSDAQLALITRSGPESSQSQECAHLAGVRVDLVSRALLNRRLITCIRDRWVGRFSYINVYAMNLANDFPWFADYLNCSIVNYCDGEGVRLAAKLKGIQIPERIAMTDWIFDVCMIAEAEQKRLYILGSKQEILELAVNRLQRTFPRLNICGWHHGYFGDAGSEEVVKLINSSSPDLLLVCLGMPYQERWIVEQEKSLLPMIILNAGSAIDYVSGTKSRCPAWMGPAGLEWLYRLFQEPRRLWRRYLIGIPRFFGIVLFGNRLDS